MSGDFTSDDSMDYLAEIRTLQREIDALKAEKEAIYAALTDEGAAVIYRVVKRVLAARAAEPKGADNGK